MSFQLNTATALPSEVQLGKEKPQGAFALRSRYALSANSASSWNAGTTLTLPLQTGTPGTFTDVKQGVITCTLQITNTNPYVDYLNFGPSGAMIFFDEMRIYSSGTPVEENLRYSETADLLTMQGGHQCRPFHIYRRNKWRANNGLAGDKHINFIKPSMVDSCGVPMFGRTPFMDKNSAVYHPPSISFGISGGGAATDFTSGSIAALNNAGDGSYGQVAGNDCTSLFNDCAYSFTTVAANSSTANAQNLQTISADFHRELGVAASGQAGSLIGYFKNTQFGMPAQSATALSIAAYMPVARYVPSQWPDFQPSTLCGEFDDDEVDSILGKSKVSEYMKYLCNVRSLPIGVQGVAVPNGYQYPCAILGAAPPAQVTSEGCRYLQYRVSMPFLSGIYGIFAEKMFPDMLIGANNIRIEFKLATNVKALWTTMDPCRRVPGTCRDFATFTGHKSNMSRIVTGQNIVGGHTTLFSVAPANAALGCANAPVNSVYSLVAADAAKITRFSEMYNSDSAMGRDLTAPFAYTTVPNGAAATDLLLSTNSFVKGSYSTTTNLPKPQVVPCTQPWACKGSGQIAIGAANADATGTAMVYCNENAACYGTYLPAAQAQSRRCWQNTKLNATSDSFANAGQTSFTIRDIQYIGEQVQLDDVVTSAIIQSAASSEIVVWTRGYRSFEASCDQNTQQNIILPIQIGQAEAMFLVFRPSIILTSPDYYSNSFSCPFVGLGYDTLPIPAVAGAVARNYDVGGVYSLASSLDTASTGSFSYQLFSGTKQYPLQPIQTVTELLTEREKSLHNLHNWDMCSTENMSLVSWGSKYGSTSNATGLDFDPFLDFGYFTTFVSVFALDDQTITQNPYLQVAEAVDAIADYTANLNAANTVLPRVRGWRCPSSPIQGNQLGGVQFQGVLNEFTSPIGSFFLGWDFESWTNHQDVMRTGKFLGQEQLSIRMTGTHLCTARNILAVGQQAQAQNIQCTAIVPHVVKMSFVPGGHMLTYY